MISNFKNIFFKNIFLNSGMLLISLFLVPFDWNLECELILAPNTPIIRHN